MRTGTAGKPLLVVMFLCALAVMPIASASSDMVEVSPAWLEITGTYGTWVSRDVSIYNPNGHEVNVSIETSSALQSAYISHPTLKIPADGHRNITIGIEMRDGHGYITYTSGGMSFNQFVLLTPSMGDVCVELLNAHPRPGGTLGFLLSEWVTGTGYVYIPSSDNIHNFQINNGMAFVQLTAVDTGDAVAVFSGEGYRARKTFTITGETGTPTGLILSASSSAEKGDTVTVVATYNDQPLPDLYLTVSSPTETFYKKTNSVGAISLTLTREGTWTIAASHMGVNKTVSIDVGEGGGNGDDVSLSIDCPGTVTVGAQEWITLLVDGNTLPSHPLTIRTPSGAIEAYSTSTMGQLRYTFSSVGSYRISFTHSGSTKNMDVNVQRGSMAIDAPDEAMAGQPVTVTVDQGSSVTMEGPAGTTTATATGTSYSFTPAHVGTYTITAETTTSRGQKSIRVYARPIMRLYDMMGNAVATAVTGNVYTVVVSHDGDPIDTQVKATAPSGFTIVLNDTLTWIPRMEGRYILSSQKTGYYMSADLPVTVTSSGGGIGSPRLYYVATILIIVAAIIGLLKRDVVADWWDRHRPRRGTAEQHHVERKYGE